MAAVRNPISALQRAIEEKDEEVETWRLRCLQAETEVRALKRSCKPAVGRAPELPIEDVLAAAVHAASQKSEGSPSPKHAAQSEQQVAKLREELWEALQSLTASEESRSAEAEELQQRSGLITQLEEEMALERRQVRKQLRNAEVTIIGTQEELNGMTQRAESLTEHLQKSKKTRSELNAAREEASRFGTELEECRLCLAQESAAAAAAQRQLPRGFCEEAKSPARSNAEEPAEEPEVHVQECPAGHSPRATSSVRKALQLPGPLSPDRSSRPSSTPTRTPVPVRASVAQQAPLQGLSSAEELHEAVQSEMRQAAAALAPLHVVPAGSHLSQQPAPLQLPGSSEAQRELHEVRLKAALEREDLLTEHGVELDDLLRQNDVERQDLYREVAEIRIECAQARANAAVMQPIIDIRMHLEGQVSAMRHELGAQLGAHLSELDACHRKQRERDVEETEGLRQDLDASRSDLVAVQEEFNTLAVEFERERREHIRLRKQFLGGTEFRSDVSGLSLFRS